MKMKRLRLMLMLMAIMMAFAMMPMMTQTAYAEGEGEEYNYYLPEDDYILPDWDGWLDNRIYGWFRNEYYPNGEDFESSIEDLNLSDGWDSVIEWRDDGEGWSYRGIAPGKVTVSAKFLDAKNEWHPFTFDINVSNTVYHTGMWPTDGVYQGLPGSSIELQADATKHMAFPPEGDQTHWHHEMTTDGFFFQWEIMEGEAFATIKNEENAPTARLVFKDLPANQQHINEPVAVKVKIYDEKANTKEAVAEQALRFWVMDDYFQIYPGRSEEISNLDVGKSYEIYPELRHYVYGQENYEVIKNADFMIEKGDFNAFDFTVSNGIDGTTIVITRKGEWDSDFNIVAYWYEGDNEESIDHWYHLNRRDYQIWFSYDEENIYEDQEVTVPLEYGNMDGVMDLLKDPQNQTYQIRYTVGRANDNGDFEKILAEDKYTANAGGITISGATLKEEGLNEGVNIRATLYVNGEERSDTWCWLTLRDSCKDEHNWIKTTVKPATCVEKGKEVWICLAHPNWNGCGQVRFVETEDFGPHKTTKVSAKESTLTETGNIEHYKCSACEKLFSDAEGAREISADSVITAKKIDISTATIAKIGDVTYNKNAQTPEITVNVGTTTLKAGTDYSVKYINNINAGTAKAEIAGLGKYGGSKAASFIIKKAKNPVKFKTKSVAVKYTAVSKKNQKVKLAKACTVSGAQGKVTWKKASGNAKIVISSNGTITVKKGIKKGTYKLVVNATAAGNANYNKLTKKVTITIKVK